VITKEWDSCLRRNDDEINLSCILFFYFWVRDFKSLTQNHTENFKLSILLIKKTFEVCSPAEQTRLQKFNPKTHAENFKLLFS
jgi:hypothetical protein